MNSKSDRHSQPGARVALYGRFSDDRQNLLSARDQIAKCDEYATQSGWRVIGRFMDEGISGAVRDRPQYQAVRAAIQAGKLDILMAESLDRITRDQEETSNLFKLCIYHRVQMFTLSEGRISELHVGLSSTINAIYLRQLAEKTHRGLDARVLSGKSAGGKAYGYRIPHLPNGLPETGELEIVPEQADVIVQILRDYAAGLSPKKIAAALNLERIPSPNGGLWKANTIHGNRQRGTGILNNELYAGKRIWNRLQYVHNPGDNKRVSRLNERDQWRIDDVPKLRIVDSKLWEAVRSRQDRIDAVRQSKDSGDAHHLSGAHAAKRPTYLLSGLIRCGSCGGPMNIGGSKPKRYYCANAREKGPAACKGIPGIAKDKLEHLVLGGLQRELMQPEAVTTFIDDFGRHQNELHGEQREKQARLLRAAAEVKKEIENILKALRAGIFTESTKNELLVLETKQERVREDIANSAEPVPAIRPDLADIYRDKIGRLVESLNDPDSRPAASEALRQLVDSVIVHFDQEAGLHQIELIGELAALLTIAQNENAAALAAASNSLKLVAGAGFEPATFRL
jgi:site-specific DNA recombinase